MGLCKCPKKKVTNQFCFEHRVNVCEFCMVTNHPKCVVQSYLQWLQDSDYNPICELCRNDLGADDCVRLICYHVFHWSCLDQYARQLPENTAPAGYICPTCKKEIFPPSNLVSPVAEKLNGKLCEVNWARIGLGLSPIDETHPVFSRSAPDGSTEESRPPHEPQQQQQQQVVVPPHQHQHRQTESTSASAAKRDSTPPRKSPFADWPQTMTQPGSSGGSGGGGSHNVVDVDSLAHYKSHSAPYTSSAAAGYFSSKRTFDSRDANNAGSPLFDHDDNKYRRRSALEWFGRWLKSITKPSGVNLRPDPNRKLKRNLMIALLVVIGFVTVVMIMMRLGRANADSDPFLDPKANPNIRVGDEGVLNN